MVFNESVMRARLPRDVSGHEVFTKQEIQSRYEIRMEAYCKTIHIEALSMLEAVKSSIVPACIGYQNELAELLQRKLALAGGYDTSLEQHLLAGISGLSGSLLRKLTTLEKALAESEAKTDRDVHAKAKFCRDGVLAAMSDLRVTVDELEMMVSKKHWPFPTYGQMLYGV